MDLDRFFHISSFSLVVLVDTVYSNSYNRLIKLLERIIIYSKLAKISFYKKKTSPAQQNGGGIELMVVILFSVGQKGLWKA